MKLKYGSGDIIIKTRQAELYATLRVDLLKEECGSGDIISK